MNKPIVKDLTDREVDIGDKFIFPFKKMDYQYYQNFPKKIEIVTGFAFKNDKACGVLYKSSDGKVRQCCTSFVIVEKFNYEC